MLRSVMVITPGPTPRVEDGRKLEYGTCKRTFEKLDRVTRPRATSIVTVRLSGVDHGSAGSAAYAYPAFPTPPEAGMNRFEAKRL